MKSKQFSRKNMDEVPVVGEVSADSAIPRSKHFRETIPQQPAPHQEMTSRPADVESEQGEPAPHSQTSTRHPENGLPVSEDNPIEEG